MAQETRQSTKFRENVDVFYFLATGNNGVKDGSTQDSSALLGIDEQQKKELMKNYDDVPLRKPLPAPGPVEPEVETEPITAQNSSSTRTEELQLNSDVGVSKDGDAKSKDAAGYSASSPTEGMKKVPVKGKPVDIPTVPELKVRQAPSDHEAVTEKVKDNMTPSASADSARRSGCASASAVASKQDTGSTNAPQASTKGTPGKKQEDLALRKTLLREIKNFSRDIEIKLQNKHHKPKDAERIRRDPDYEQKKKIEELRKKDLQDYPYEDVDVQTTHDGSKQMQSSGKTRTMAPGGGNRSPPEGVPLPEKTKKKVSALLCVLQVSYFLPYKSQCVDHSNPSVRCAIANNIDSHTV